MIRAKCLRALNVLKYLSHPFTGCNRKVLVPIHQSLIRFILDYATPIYGMAPLTSRYPRFNSKFGDPFLHWGLLHKPCTQLLRRLWLGTTPLSTPHTYHYSPHISRATPEHSGPWMPFRNPLQQTYLPRSIHPPTHLPLVSDTHLPTITPCSIPLLKILFQRTHLPKKSTDPSIYRAHFHEIPYSFSDSHHLIHRRL